MTTNIFFLCCHLLDLLNRLRKYFVGMVVPRSMFLDLMEYYEGFFPSLGQYVLA